MYATYTRRFLRYLEETGVVVIPNDTARLGQHLEAFAEKLDTAGYSKVCHNTAQPRQPFCRMGFPAASSGDRNR